MSLLKIYTYTQMIEFILQNNVEIKKLYKYCTAKEIAEHFHIFYNGNWQKALIRTMGDKGLGHGGARQGAGRFRPSENAVYSRKLIRKRKQIPFAFGLSEEAAKILNESGGKHTDFVEKAIQHYHEFLKAKDLAN